MYLQRDAGRHQVLQEVNHMLISIVQSQISKNRQFAFCSFPFTSELQKEKKMQLPIELILGFTVYLMKQGVFWILIIWCLYCLWIINV